MNANFIKARIDAVIQIAEMRAAENAILEEWYNSTADSARKIQSHIEKDVIEFENMALALSALQSNVPMVDTSILFNGVDEMLKELDRYDPGDADTAYGSVIKVTKDSLANVGSTIIDAIQSLSILEAALGLDKIPDQFILKEPIMVSEKRNINLPSQICDMHDPFSSVAALNSTSTEVVSEDTAEKEKTVPDSDEPETDDNSEPEEEKIVDKTPDEKPRTLFGVPIEQIEEAVPDINIEALIEPAPSTTAAAAPDKNPGVKPQKLSRGFTEVHLPNFPTDQFMISEKNLLVDRYTGRVIRTFRRHGTEMVAIRHHGSNTEELFEFEDIIKAARDDNESKPKSQTVDEKTHREVREERFRFVDWIDGLPKTKYKVFESGRIYDTVHGEFITVSGERVTLSAGDRESKTPGVHSPMFAFTRQSIVYRAFHPEVRDKIKLHIKFKDGNRKNCALSNLVYNG